MSFVFLIIYTFNFEVVYLVVLQEPIFFLQKRSFNNREKLLNAELKGYGGKGERNQVNRWLSVEIPIVPKRIGAFPQLSPFPLFRLLVILYSISPFPLSIFFISSYFTLFWWNWSGKFALRSEDGIAESGVSAAQLYINKVYRL